ncbi:hypothetical protein AB0A63_38635 [Lentzea sp. NPDC042327]|uniref:hypothetical protein n=1 Tax=Lentzea sp. NPDC042327 TaxID=3154801 RepID=UPI0033EC9D55
MASFKALFAIAALAAGGVAIPVSASASDVGALACSQHSHSAKDTFNRGRAAKSSIPIRSAGPYSGCSIDGYVDNTVNLHYHCYVTNSAGNTWTWVRVVDQPVAGWVWDENLVGGGSAVRC